MKKPLKNTAQNHSAHIFLRGFFDQVYNSLIKPKSENEDTQRNEYILNVILIGSIILAFWGDAFILRSKIYNVASTSYIALSLFAAITALFIGTLILSRMGYRKTAAYIVIAIYFIGATYGIYRWGPNLPASLLGYALVIVISGILINSRAALLTTAASSITITIFGILESRMVVLPDIHWKNNLFNPLDAVQYSVMLFVIMIVSWLSAREIERYIKQIRSSREELKQERDLLEIRVEERTREIRHIQAEKISQLYRFAEYGKLASGIFHDLANPLTAVSLNIEQIQKTNKEEQIALCLDRAKIASKTMQQFLEQIRSQIREEDNIRPFSVKKEIEDTAEMFSHKTEHLSIKILVRSSPNLFFSGSQIKFHQIISNLISNALDAYREQGKSGQIEVRANEYNNSIALSVKDSAGGIKEELQEKIFEPFFSTKGDKGMGLGLPTTKHIVEKDFGGKIDILSKHGTGTTFRITLPKTKPIKKVSSESHWLPTQGAVRDNTLSGSGQ